MSQFNIFRGVQLSNGQFSLLFSKINADDKTSQANPTSAAGKFL